MLSNLRTRIRREQFLTSSLGIIFNPLYIIRNGLYKTILSFSSKLGGNLLDLGCGSKPYRSLFAHVTQYTGLDIEISGHDHTNSQADCFYDGKKIPFPDNHFDGLVSFEVFEHIFNLDDIMKEAHRVLKPEALILISIPFAWDEHEIPYDFARYTSYGIQHILERNGFEIIKIQKTTTYFLAIMQMFIAYLIQYVFPKNRVFSRFFQIFIICPLTILSLLFNEIFPKRYEYFCNIVIFGRNVKVQ